jgi:hypothetical protein
MEWGLYGDLMLGGVGVMGRSCGCTEAEQESSARQRCGPDEAGQPVSEGRGQWQFLPGTPSCVRDGKRRRHRRLTCWVS